MKTKHPVIRMRILACLVPLLFMSTPSAADIELHITIENNRFVPAEIKAPPGQRIKLMILNKDRTPEEFESYILNIEKIIPGGSRGLVFIRPQMPGRYKFFGEFHQDTAQGELIVE
jgi:plastocyanin